MSSSRLTEEEETVGRFRSLFGSMVGVDERPETLPSTMAAAAQQTLAADGAGLSIFDSHHRVPIGGSTDVALIAERLQFTVGEGPCLDSFHSNRAVRVDEEQMREEWPPFHAELTAQTPYRSIVAVPIQVFSGVRGALDIYFRTDSMPAYSVVRGAGRIGDEIARLLVLAEPIQGAHPRWDAAELPAWVYGPQSQQRLRTWIAVGMLVAKLDLDPDSAMTTLRAYAYSRDIAVDQLTNDLIGGVVRPEALG